MVPKTLMIEDHEKGFRATFFEGFGRMWHQRGRGLQESANVKERGGIKISSTEEHVAESGDSGQVEASNARPALMPNPQVPGDQSHSR